MLIRLDDPALVDDLCAHYLRSGFTAEQVGVGLVEVARPEAPNPDQEPREAIMHLRVWQVLHPDAHAQVT